MRYFNTNRVEWFMEHKVKLWVIAASVVLGFLLPSFGEAASGPLNQLGGTAGCIARAGDGITCADGGGLNGAGWVAVSPDGRNVYVTAFTGSALTTYARNASTGGVDAASRHGGLRRRWWWWG